MKISKPAPGRDRWPRDEHIDHLHLFAGGLTVENVATSRGPADAAKVDIVACIDCREGWLDQLVFGKVMVPRLTDDPDASVVVARLSQGLAKPGQSPAWLLDDPTDAEVADAETFAGKYIAELPSGTMVLDFKALDADRGDGDQEPF